MKSVAKISPRGDRHPPRPKERARHWSWSELLVLPSADRTGVKARLEVKTSRGRGNIQRFDAVFAVECRASCGLIQKERTEALAIGYSHHRMDFESIGTERVVEMTVVSGGCGTNANVIDPLLSHRPGNVSDVDRDYRCPAWWMIVKRHTRNDISHRRRFQARRAGQAPQKRRKQRTPAISKSSWPHTGLKFGHKFGLGSFH
jgi:hypothetical protein